MATGTPRVGTCGRMLDNGCQRRKDSFHSALSDLGLPFGRHQNLDQYGGRPQRDDVTPAIGILMALEPARSAAGPASSSWVQQASRRKTASGRVDIQCWGTIRTPAAAIW